MAVRVYYSSISGNATVKKHQHEIIGVLSAKKVDFEKIDLSDPSSEEIKASIYEKIKTKERCIQPPHIFYGEDYLGDYSDFQNAIEMEELEVFLNLTGEKPKSFVALLNDKSSVEESPDASENEIDDSSDDSLEEKEGSMSNAEADSQKSNHSAEKSDHSTDSESRKSIQSNEETGVAEQAAKSEVTSTVAMGKSGNVKSSDDSGGPEGKDGKTNEGEGESSDKESTATSDSHSSGASSKETDGSSENDEAKSTRKNKPEANASDSSENDSDESDSSEKSSDSD